MGKMKVEALKETERDFFYEIAGTFLVLLGIIFIGRFGTVGNFFSIILHILFGDYVFILMVLLIVIGLRGIIKKKFINPTSINFLGFWMLYIGLSLFCCFSLYKGLETNQNHYLKDTLSLYKRYLTNYQASYTCGGGLLVGTIFQVLILFFGYIGIYLFSIILLGMGLFFLSGLTFFNLFKKRHGILKIIKRIILVIICFFKRIEIPKKKNDEVKLQTSMLTEAPKSSNMTIQKEYNSELLSNLKAFLFEKDAQVKIYEVITSYFSSRIIVSKNAKVYLEDIKQYFINKVFFIENEDEIYLDYINKFKTILSLKSLISMGVKYRFPIGMELDGNVFGWNNIDNHLFIAGDLKQEIDEYLKNILILIHLEHKEKSKIYFLCDEKVFQELKTVYTVNYLSEENRISELLDEIIEEYEKREELLKYLNVDNFNDVKYNKNVIDKDEIYIIIRMKLNKVDKSVINKVNFLLKNANRYGIYILIIMNYLTDIPLIERQNQPIMVFKTLDILMSVKLLNNDTACYLNKNSECLLLENKKINHLALSYVTDSDYHDILKKFTG